MTSTAGRGGDTTTCATVAPRETELETQTPVHIVVRPERRVAWDPSVVDNEHLGRKSSKCLSLPLSRPDSISSSAPARFAYAFFCENSVLHLPQAPCVW